jgi:hypothetical protein
LRREDIRTTVDAHSCKVFRAKLVRV